MIETITLKAGSSSQTAPLETGIGAISIFVGPNNSGKSLLLKEIYNWCTNPIGRNLILNNITLKGHTESKANQIIKDATTSKILESTGEEKITLRFGFEEIESTHASFFKLLTTIEHIGQFRQNYLKFQTRLLGGKERLSLTNPVPVSDLRSLPKSNLHKLFIDDKKRQLIQKLVYDAFKEYLVIDPTHSGNLGLRLSQQPPQNTVERSLTSEAFEFFAKAPVILEYSDGVRAYVGMLLEVISGDPELLLIDEPEAFLHPSLVFNLGKELASMAQNSGKQLFFSTHSSHFIMGCIHSGVPLNIIRLTYREKIGTARNISGEKVSKLMKNPLLRSTGVLLGLFYEFVVVTESDSDRAFYQEINERLLKFDPNSGIPNCLFLNAQNKQTVHKIIEPLRELGIPTVGIVDIDILKEGGSVWSSFLKGGFIPDPDIQPYGTIRARSKEALEKTGKCMKRNGGIDLLGSEEKESTNNLFDRLAEYGLFVVRKGELECWLKPVGATSHGPEWLIELFDKIGEDPEDSNYLKPSAGDVWDFMRQIRAWMMNPSRKGIPA